MSQGFTGTDKNSLLNHLVNGRLTLTSGSPVTTSDVSGSTIYFTPYKGNRIFLYNTTTSKWELFNFSEISATIPLTTNTNYDVFIYNNSGTLTLELVAWTDNTTRATPLTTQDYVYVKSGDANKRYLGTIRTGATAGQAEDKAGKRFVWNYYNRVKKSNFTHDSSVTSWTSISTSYEQMNGGNLNWKHEFVVGIDENTVYAFAGVHCRGTIVILTIALDTTTTFTQNAPVNSFDGTANMMLFASYFGNLGIGYHYLQVLDRIYSSGTAIFYNENSSSPFDEYSAFKSIFKC